MSATWDKANKNFCRVAGLCFMLLCLFFLIYPAVMWLKTGHRGLFFLSEWNRWVGDGIYTTLPGPMSPLTSWVGLDKVLYWLEGHIPLAVFFFLPSVALLLTAG